MLLLASVFGKVIHDLPPLLLGAHALKENATLIELSHVLLVFSGDFQIIYDGAVLLKKGFVGAIYDYCTSADKHERAKGCIRMLPDWAAEITKGTSLQQLSLWIENVVSRQMLVLSAFQPEKDYKEKDLSAV